MTLSRLLTPSQDWMPETHVTTLECPCLGHLFLASWCCEKRQDYMAPCRQGQFLLSHPSWGRMLLSPNSMLPGSGVPHLLGNSFSKAGMFISHPSHGKEWKTGCWKSQCSTHQPQKTGCPSFQELGSVSSFLSADGGKEGSV